MCEIESKKIESKITYSEIMEQVVADFTGVIRKRMKGEAIFINAMEESTARMDKLLGVGGKGGGIITVLEADLSDTENRIQEARLG